MWIFFVCIHKWRMMYIDSTHHFHGRLFFKFRKSLLLWSPTSVNPHWGWLEPFDFSPFSLLLVGWFHQPGLGVDVFNIGLIIVVQIKRKKTPFVMFWCQVCFFFLYLYLPPYMYSFSKFWNNGSTSELRSSCSKTKWRDHISPVLASTLASNKIESRILDPPPPLQRCPWSGTIKYHWSHWTISSL